MRMGLVGFAVLAACGGSSGGFPDAIGDDDGPPDCAPVCSADGKSVQCGNAVTDCAPTEFCDTNSNSCQNACAQATADHSSIGCDYYATSMDVFDHGDCFAAFVANTYSAPAHLTVTHQGVDLPVSAFTKIPTGNGGTMSYADYDPIAGIAPGEVAVIFLAGRTTQTSPAVVLCPFDGATTIASFAGSGVSRAGGAGAFASPFEIGSDVPVVAYQMNPYGGGSASVSGASLLLPTSVWDTSYLAVNAFGQGPASGGNPTRASFGPSMNIIAAEDDTVVTIVPNNMVVGGNGIPASNAGVAMQINLNKGEQAQITQNTELTGSPITSTKPIGLMAGQPCMNVPTNQDTNCDHGEQMIPPIRAVGSSYAAVMYRPRAGNETSTFWRVVGVVDGTQLTYSTAVGGPTTLAKGQVVLFQTGTPFLVTAQDAAHPFMLFEYMTGSGAVGTGAPTSASGLGDPDFVVDIPPDQYLKRYVFFTDPTYPETDLVVVRKRDTLGGFHDVTLDCAGTLIGWQSIGNDFQFTRVDLSTGNFQNVGNCSTGRREMFSDEPFGLWIWGWGSVFTTPQTRSVSYGYPGGMNVQPINNVIL